MEQNDIDNLNDKTGRKFRIIKDDDKFFASYNKVTKMCREGFSFPIHPFEIVRLSEVLNITPEQFCEENTNIIFESEENVPCFIMNISSGCKFAKEYECCLGKDKPGACAYTPLCKMNGVRKDNENQVETIFLIDDNDVNLGDKEYTLKEWLHINGLEEESYENKQYFLFLFKLLKIVDFRVFKDESVKYDDLKDEHKAFIQKYYLYKILTTYKTNFTNEEVDELLNGILKFYTEFVMEFPKYKASDFEEE